jgi:hypothetical protein
MLVLENRISSAINHLAGRDDQACWLLCNTYLVPGPVGRMHYQPRQTQCWSHRKDGLRWFSTISVLRITLGARPTIFIGINLSDGKNERLSSKLDTLVLRTTIRQRYYHGSCRVGSGPGPGPQNIRISVATDAAIAGTVTIARFNQAVGSRRSQQTCHCSNHGLSCRPAHSRLGALDRHIVQLRPGPNTAAARKKIKQQPVS